MLRCTVRKTSKHVVKSAVRFVSCKRVSKNTHSFCVCVCRSSQCTVRYLHCQCIEVISYCPCGIASSADEVPAPLQRLLLIACFIQRTGLLISFCGGNVCRRCELGHAHNHVVSLTTGIQPLPKRVLSRVRSSTSSLNSQYLLFLRLLTSSPSSFHPLYLYINFFPSVTCFRRQFLRKM